MRIYGLIGCNLGDVWASVNFALSDCKSHHVPISCWSPERFDRTELLWEIATVLHQGNRIHPVTEERNCSPQHLEAFTCPFQPVRQEYRWRYPGKSYVACQLKGTSGAELKDCTDEEVELLRRLIRSDRLVTLGLPMTLTDSIRALSRCRVFLGIESGMAHVNHSVGAPAVLMENRCNEDMLALHASRQGTWVRDMSEAIELLSSEDSISSWHRLLHQAP